MGCCGDREKGESSISEKWEDLNLDDFKSESCMAPFSYFFLYVFLLVSLAVYAVDIFTAVNLLAFSRWAGQIKPAIPFEISRWIFAACIIVSFVLLVLRWLNAIRAIRSHGIAQSYLDPLAMRVQSVRMGQRGRGWRRFLVFAELTKHRKGAEYVALYTYFSFEAWMNTVFADGPRQVVNAITIYSVTRMDLIPNGKNASADEDISPILQFFNNVKILAVKNDLRAIVLFGMLFTVVIWVLKALKLASAVILYLSFLWHYIPSHEGSLKSYCQRRINKRLKRIVAKKVDKALANGVALQDRKPNQPNAAGGAKPTLPSIGDTDTDKEPSVGLLSRTTTQTTLPPYTPESGTTGLNQDPTLPSLSVLGDKPPLSRTVTQSSAYSESTSLSESAATTYSPLDRQNSPIPPVPPIPAPSMRSNSPMSRPPTSQSRGTPARPTPFNGPGRSTPGARYPGASPGPQYNIANYPPSRDPTPHAPPHRPFNPGADAYARSLAPNNPSARGTPPVGYTPRPTPAPPSRGGPHPQTANPNPHAGYGQMPSMPPCGQPPNRAAYNPYAGNDSYAGNNPRAGNNPYAGHDPYAGKNSHTGNNPYAYQDPYARNEPRPGQQGPWF